MSGDLWIGYIHVLESCSIIGSEDEKYLKKVNISKNRKDWEAITDQSNLIYVFIPQNKDSRTEKKKKIKATKSEITLKGDA